MYKIFQENKTLIFPKIKGETLDFDATLQESDRYDAELLCEFLPEWLDDRDLGETFIHEVGENGLAPRDAVFQFKGGTFLHVDADGDIDFIEDGQGPQNDGTMPQSDGVEGTGENGYSFHRLCCFGMQKYHFATIWRKSFAKISLMERKVFFRKLSISSFPISFISVMPSSVCGLGWMVSSLSIRYQ